MTCPNNCEFVAEMDVNQLDPCEVHGETLQKLCANCGEFSTEWRVMLWQDDSEYYCLDCYKHEFRFSGGK